MNSSLLIPYSSSVGISHSLQMSSNALINESAASTSKSVSFATPIALPKNANLSMAPSFANARHLLINIALDIP